ncbi:hypothetical protein ASD79_06950 [Caulobacter sp. Root655]|nr:hypothetical protein ASD79_06950 [Caulobacter sp. Root655]
MFLAAGAAQATPAESSWMRVNALVGGWTSAGLRIQTGGTFFNPEACAIQDGYFLDPSLPAASLFWSMLLTAQSMGVDVQLTVDGCIYSRPKIIGVALRR